jgi:adhesin transport system outer membrane protein
MGYTQNHDLAGVRGLNADRIAMLRLRYNLYRGGADVSRIREAEARIDESASGLEKARIDVERDVRQAWQNLKAERMRLPQQGIYARTSADVLEAYRAQFKLGQRSLLDLLNTENELFGARSGHVSGEYSVLAGEYRLLASMGRLLGTLGVELPAELPTALPTALPTEGEPKQKAQ